MITIIVPGVPVAKARPRFTKVGRVFTAKKTEDYEDAVRLFANRAMAGRVPMDGPVRVSVFAFVPIPKSWSMRRKKAALAYHILPECKPDGDNFLKIVDALNGCVWRDDAQAIVSTVVKVYGPTPQLRIEVSRIFTQDIIELLRNREAA